MRKIFYIRMWNKHIASQLMPVPNEYQLTKAQTRVREKQKLVQGGTRQHSRRDLNRGPTERKSSTINQLSQRATRFLYSDQFQ